MKKSRFVALATASAVALSPVVPAQAAQVGPLEQNRCKVAFTAAEKAYLENLDREISAKVGETFYRDFNLALENTFPGIRSVGDDFVAAYQHQLTNHRVESAFEDAFDEIDLQPYLSRLSYAGLNDTGAETYLDTRARAEYFNDMRVSPDEVVPSNYSDHYVDAKLSEDFEDGNIGAVILFIFLGLGGVIQDENQGAKFYNSFDKTQTGRHFTALNPYLRAENAASNACLGGGNSTVKYPTGAATPKPTPKPTPSKPKQDSKSSDQNADNNAGQAKDEKGSSTAGIVIGVIAAVLAVIGIAAIAAPQLGIQIPGLG